MRVDDDGDGDGEVVGHDKYLMKEVAATTIPVSQSVSPLVTAQGRGPTPQHSAAALLRVQ